MAKSGCHWKCPDQWAEWSEWLAAGLHARNHWRLPVLLLGILFAQGRRTVTTWLRAAGVSDLAVLHAFDQVPRHLFVPEVFEARAYADEALPLGHGQTISRPSTHALYLQCLGLTGDERILEYVTGFLQAAHADDERYTVRDGINVARYAFKLMADSVRDPRHALRESVVQILGEDALRHLS